MREHLRSSFALSVVLLCHDEEENIGDVVREALKSVARLADRFEIVVVDDGSGDATPAVLSGIARAHPQVRVVRNPVNLGYGGALARGLKEARLPWVFYTDGDGQFELSDLEVLVPWLDEHEIVCGYRARRRDGRLRRLNGKMWTWLMNSLLDLDVQDVNCAFKIFPRSLFDQIEMRSTGAFIDAEILSQAKRLGLRIAEVGVRHRARVAGQPSGARPGVIYRALLDLATFMVRQRTLASRAEIPG